MSDVISIDIPLHLKERTLKFLDRIKQEEIREVNKAKAEKIRAKEDEEKQEHMKLQRLVNMEVLFDITAIPLRDRLKELSEEDSLLLAQDLLEILPTTMYTLGKYNIREFIKSIIVYKKNRGYLSDKQETYLRTCVGTLATAYMKQSK